MTASGSRRPHRNAPGVPALGTPAALIEVRPSVSQDTKQDRGVAAVITKHGS